MDYLPKIIFVLFMAFGILGNASANFPAGISGGTYCYSPNGAQSAYNCPGTQKFESPEAAAMYGCQTDIFNAALGYNTYVITNVITGPAGTAAGLNQASLWYWGFTCSAKNSAGTPSQSTKPVASSNIVALAKCDGGVPIANYAPATCQGQPYNPPVACSSTVGVAIAAFHPAPTNANGCYAGCGYTASQTQIVTYNGTQFDTGSWVGSGAACVSTDVALTGGVPGSAQNVGSTTGLVPADIAGLAKDATLLNLIQVVQAGNTSSNGVASANKVLLEQIAASTAQSAAGGSSPTSVPDPDGLENLYATSLATKVDAGGKFTAAGLPTDTVDVGDTFAHTTGFISNAACPQMPTFTVKGHSYQFDISIVCQLGQALSYVVVACASIVGVRIFAGGV